MIKAPENSARNVYVQGLKVNGLPWTSTSLPHSIVSQGGTLEFDMGAEPSAWGRVQGRGPGVDHAGRRGALRRRADVVVGEGALFDNTSATNATVESVELPIAGDAKAVQYTLTSADRGEAPTGWVLQGSRGRHRPGTATLDRRSGESFRWDRQTRVFSVAFAGSYARYRLVLDGESTLAEVELLG